MRRIEFQGETLSIAQWARKYGLPEQTVYNRLDAGWSVERALTTPVRGYREHQRLPEHDGESLTAAQ